MGTPNDRRSESLSRDPFFIEKPVKEEEYVCIEIGCWN